MIVHTNRRGKAFYLHERRTASGKKKYVFSFVKEGPFVESIPEGYEVYENPNGQVFLRLMRADAPRDFIGPGDLGKIQQFLAGGERVEPDIAQPPLEQQQHLRAATAVFGLDGGGQLVFPFLAQILFGVAVFFQRRTCG